MRRLCCVRPPPARRREARRFHGREDRLRRRDPRRVASAAPVSARPQRPRPVGLDLERSRFQRHAPEGRGDDPLLNRVDPYPLVDAERACIVADIAGAIVATMAAGRENVRFIGRVEPDRARDLMVEQARVLVLPAVAGEGMPNVLLEAMSVGIPVIATDVAGVRDLVEHGVSGLVAPAGDAAALEEAVVQLWGDKALRERLGQAGRRTAAGYGWDKVVASHLEVLGAVARGGIHGN